MSIPIVAIPETPPLIDWLEQEFDPSDLSGYLELGDDAVPQRLWEQALLGPLRDILSRPGKEFRRDLVSFAWRLSGGASPPPIVLTLLVEILHAGSLVVDDIEDGSRDRRGGPALHAIYGVPTALNAGNWLYFWPFALLTRLGLEPDVELLTMRDFTKTLMACHHGQALDLTVKLGHLAQREIPRVVRATTKLKTGSLLALAARLGARTAGANPAVERALGTFGRELGVGLQMLDDLGGLVTSKRRHKGHEDLRLGRVTWPWAWLSDRLDQVSFQKLKWLAAEVEKRWEHPERLAVAMRHAMAGCGREAVHQHLTGARDDLARAVGRSALIDSLDEQIGRMEASYVG